MINDGNPVVWLFLYIRYLIGGQTQTQSVKSVKSVTTVTGRFNACQADRFHSPRILGFVRSDYRQQVIVHQEIAHGRITEERNRVTPNTPDRQARSCPITRAASISSGFNTRKRNTRLDDTSRRAVRLIELSIWITA